MQMGLLAGLVSVLPLVSHVVQAVESLFGRGNGARKKDAAVAAVADSLNIYGALTGKQTTTSQVTAALGQVIDALVAFYNAAGVFAHTPK